MYTINEALLRSNLEHLTGVLHCQHLRVFGCGHPLEIMRLRESVSIENTRLVLVGCFLWYAWKMNTVVGIDEAGRGPLAGPVSVGVISAPISFDIAREFPGVADSKALSAKKREILFTMLLERAAIGDVRYEVKFSTAEYIDTHGITQAVSSAIEGAIGVVAPDPENTLVLLDGLLSAPKNYCNQKTIIHGDAIEPIISLASIAAKVLRDRKMVGFDVKYPQYGFAQHKGYGTKKHRTAIIEFGVSPIHRRTFLRKIVG